MYVSTAETQRPRTRTVKELPPEALLEVMSYTAYCVMSGAALLYNESVAPTVIVFLAVPGDVTVRSPLIRPPTLRVLPSLPAANSGKKSCGVWRWALNTNNPTTTAAIPTTSAPNHGTKLMAAPGVPS